MTKTTMFARTSILVSIGLLILSNVGVLPASESVPLIQESNLPIARLIPGNRKVTIEWLRPQWAVDPSGLQYRIAVKFRTAPWEEARTVVLPGDQTSATLTGLLNNADCTVRVVAERQGTSQVIARSVERLITPGAIPGVVIDYLHKDDRGYAKKGQYIGSPSIARLDNGRLVASHDLFGRGGSHSFSRIFRSEDGGRAWRHLADVERAFWGKLFVHRGELYLLACSRQNGDLVLHHSPDGGDTWNPPVVLAPGSYHKAPVPVIVRNDRLWTCVELQTGGWPAGFQAVALSAPADADLLDAGSWTVSKPLPYDPAWLPQDWDLPNDREGFLEGNAVVDPQGRLLNILRCHVSPHFGKAIVLNISPDARSLSFDRVIDFYGGMTKFTIRRHPRTGVYWSLVNRVTRPDKAAMRSVLTLVSSSDLEEWNLVRDILRDDREVAHEYTGFQYIDWFFDGQDIIFVSRTAYNGAHNYHDANHLTFHRIRNFGEKGRWAGP